MDLWQHVLREANCFVPSSMETIRAV